MKVQSRLISFSLPRDADPDCTQIKVEDLEPRTENAPTSSSEIRVPEPSVVGSANNKDDKLMASDVNDSASAMHDGKGNNKDTSEQLSVAVDETSLQQNDGAPNTRTPSSAEYSISPTTGIFFTGTSGGQPPHIQSVAVLIFCNNRYRPS